jgi:hypothetical protein
VVAAVAPEGKVEAIRVAVEVDEEEEEVDDDAAAVAVVKVEVVSRLLDETEETDAGALPSIVSPPPILLLAADTRCNVSADDGGDGTSENA